MPTRLKKPCAYPLCPELAAPGERYCSKHRTARRQEDREYKRRRADKEEQAFYTSERWRRLRKWKLMQNPLCEECGALAQIVDHIKPIKEGGDPMLIDNLQSLCIACHNRKHMGGRGKSSEADG
ncbi:MAG: HNH endonuclease [Firmicutes bacterium]|nr:HNH endonuclease [Bacillota bacterium]